MMATNKVEIIENGVARTLMDVSSDTATPETVAEGETFHGADGEEKVGILKLVTVDSELSETSTNPVQNAVVAKQFGQLSDQIADLGDCKPLVVTISEEEDGKFVSSHSYNEILENLNNGNSVKLTDFYGMEYTEVQVSETENNVITFYQIYVDMQGVYKYAWHIYMTGLVVEDTVQPDFIPISSTAQVGQTIVVKSVDENGKPTEWECVDVDSGGSSLRETGILLHSVTLEEETSSLYIDVDYNQYKCVYATVYSATRNVNRSLFIGVNEAGTVVPALTFYNAATILIMPLTKSGHVFISYDSYKGTTDTVSTTNGYSRQGVAVNEIRIVKGIRLSTSDTFVVGDIIKIYGVER